MLTLSSSPIHRWKFCPCHSGGCGEVSCARHIHPKAIFSGSADDWASILQGCSGRKSTSTPQLPSVPSYYSKQTYFRSLIKTQHPVCMCVCVCEGAQEVAWSGANMHEPRLLLKSPQTSPLSHINSQPHNSECNPLALILK